MKNATVVYLAAGGVKPPKSNYLKSILFSAGVFILLLAPEQKRMQCEERSLTRAVCPQSTASSECLSLI